jgi:hypothetical protein
MANFCENITKLGVTLGFYRAGKLDQDGVWSVELFIIESNENCVGELSWPILV